jgi:hypothetical protein
MMAIKRKPRRKPCPYCGSRDTGQILYGEYLPNPERPLPDHVVLGGCCMPENPPKRYCHSCGRFDDGTIRPIGLDDLEG